MPEYSKKIFITGHVDGLDKTVSPFREAELRIKAIDPHCFVFNSYIRFIGTDHYPEWIESCVIELEKGYDELYLLTGWNEHMPPRIIRRVAEALKMKIVYEEFELPNS